jgi:predicted RNase H-like HicB family nuclease
MAKRPNMPKSNRRDLTRSRHEGRRHFTAVFRKVPEGYIGFVEELLGANTPGATLEEAWANLKEAVSLVIEADRVLSREDAGPDTIREPIKVTA